MFALFIIMALCITRDVPSNWRSPGETHRCKMHVMLIHGLWHLLGSTGHVFTSRHILGLMTLWGEFGQSGNL